LQITGHRIGEVICVLLKEAEMCARPWETVRRSFFFLNLFFFCYQPPPVFPVERLALCSLLFCHDDSVVLNF